MELPRPLTLWGWGIQSTAKNARKGELDTHDPQFDELSVDYLSVGHCTHRLPDDPKVSRRDAHPSMGD